MFIIIPKFRILQVYYDIAYLDIMFVIRSSTKISVTDSKFFVMKPVFVRQRQSIPPIV